MANKISNVSYDQIPHVVINHPDTNPEHKEIMRALFKVLKDSPRPIIYTNESISENCRISLRNVERRIPELVKFGLINCTGRGYNRRISLGLLFNTSAILAVRAGQELNNSAKSAITTAKSDPHNRQYGGDYNPYTKPSTNADLSANANSTPKTLTPSQEADLIHFKKYNMQIPPELLAILNEARLSVE